MAKRQVDHTIADIVRLEPKWFMAKQTDSDKTKTILKHILTIMEAGHHHMTEYFFYDVFETYDISVLEMHEVNKALMEHIHETRRTIPPLVTATRITRLSLIPPADLREAVKPDKSMIADRMRQIRHTIEDREAQLREYEGYLRDYRQSYTRAAREIVEAQRQLHGAELDFEAETGTVDAKRLATLRIIPKQWVVVQANKDSFTLVRRTPITIAHLNRETGMCRTLYLGYIGLRFDYTLQCHESFHMADYTYTGSNSRIHPHVSGSHLCFGTGQHRAETLRAEGKQAEYFELLETILTTYSPENPYIAWGDLDRAKSTGWRGLNLTYLKNKQWWTENQAGLRQMLSEGCSDRLMEQLRNTRSESYSPDFVAERRKRFIAWCNAQTKLVAVAAKQLNERIVEMGGMVSGEVLRNLILSTGAKMPSLDAFRKHGITSIYDCPIRMLQYMCIVHGAVPAVRGRWTLMNDLQGDDAGIGLVSFFQSDAPHIHRLGSAYEDGRSARRVCDTPIREDAPEPVLPSVVMPTPWAVAPSPAEPEDFEEYPENDYDPAEDCEHDEYNSEGYCVDCDHYDESHDTRLSADSEEEEHEEAPF